MKTLLKSPTAKPSKIKILPKTQNLKSKPKSNQMKILRPFEPGVTTHTAQHAAAAPVSAPAAKS
jgi:hypothetical protein